MREIEIKLRVPDLEPIEAKLRALGCAISAPLTQTDINFIHRDDVRWFEPLDSEWVYPRLRIQSQTDTNGNKETETLIFTIKNLSGTSDCQNTSFMDDPEEALNDEYVWFEDVTVKKVRRTTSPEPRFCSRRRRLGNFIEIERVITDQEAAQQGAEKIQEEMTAFAEKMFGLKRIQVVLQGYDIQMYYAQK